MKLKVQLTNGGSGRRMFQLLLPDEVCAKVDFFHQFVNFLFLYFSLEYKNYMKKNKCISGKRYISFF